MAVCVRTPDAAFARETLINAFAPETPRLTALDTVTQEAVALIAVITSPGGDVEPRVLTALGRAKAHVLGLARAAHGSHLSLLVPESELGEVVRVMHDELGLA